MILNPLCRGNFIPNQSVHRDFIGNPEQGLGQPHQREPLGRIKGIFLQKTFQLSRRPFLGTHGLNPLRGLIFYAQSARGIPIETFQAFLKSPNLGF